MKKLLGMVFNRWLLLGLLLAALSLVIWIVGPMVAVNEHRPLENENSRWAAIAAVWLSCVLISLARAWSARRGNAAVVKQLLAAPPSGSTQVESPDLVAVRERFEEALATLRQVRFGAADATRFAGRVARLGGRWLGGRYLYELPWYLIIGAPGSGKTTALKNCGLQFPLADKVGEVAVRGVGGTRHCDWWFTDRAVLIDTAGRFTTQDSDRERDRSTWSGFLAMLAKARPRQPLNGVLVTVSLTDLLARSAEDRARHAATVRARIQELQQSLAIRLPVYLLVTKCDLLAGFMDYFATLDKGQRAAPWGFTFSDAGAAATAAPPRRDSRASGAGALGALGAPGLARLGAEFELLQLRLTDGLIDRLQSERDPARRARIYAFAGQFANLLPPLQEFVDAAFTPSRLEAHRALVRGVYFISGTQEGTPIDRVLGQVARSYKLENAVLAPNQASGRSYFLTRLLDEVVFAESGLAGTNLRWERRRAQLALAGYAAIAVLGIGATVAWAVSFGNNRRYVADVAARVEAVRQRVQTTPNRHSPDLLPILPALEQTRRLASPQSGDSTVPRSLGYGLFQGRKLDSAAHAAYDRMLVDAVQPRLALRIEEQLRQSGHGDDDSGSAPETQYEALKMYLMLHDPERIDPKALKAYFEHDWDARLGREPSSEQRAALSEQLDGLLALGAVVAPVPPDAALVAATRAQLTSVPLPQRVYHRMRREGLGADFAEFSVVRAAGNNAALVFTRTSGKPLTAGVPGLFTRDGYYKGFQQKVGQASSELAQEQGWVLGVGEARQPSPGPSSSSSLSSLSSASLSPSASSSSSLADDVRRLYLNDYAAAWSAFIADVRIVPLTSLAQSTQTARLLAAPDSPLPPLLRALSRETTLAGPASKDIVDKLTDRATRAVRQGADKLKGMVAPGAPVASGPPLEAIVDDRFAGLRYLTSAPEGGGKPPLDDTMALIGEVYVLLNAVETAVQGGAAPPPSPVPNKVKAVAAASPEPVRSLLDTLSSSSAHQSQLNVRQNLSQTVRSEVGDFCNQALAGRYPLDPRSTRDATPADFAQIFGPGGKIDRVFQDKLSPYVDTSTRPWRFRPVEGTPLGSDSGSLPQFQRAAVVRETFFPAGAAPSLKLEFKPVEMDPGLTQFVLDVDGQVVRYLHGPQIPTTVQWPGPRGSAQVRLQVTPPSATGNSGMVTEGPWALFRMLDRARLEPSGAPEKFRVTFDVDGRKAVFDVTASSVRNPFHLRELNEFSCPSGL